MVEEQLLRRVSRCPNDCVMTGNSFCRLLQGVTIPEWPNQVFCEYSSLLGDQPSCMVRVDQWKLNYYSEFDSCQLFNIASDPEERNDLAGKPECLVIVNQLKARIDSRWSAEDILESQARQQRGAAVLEGAGHSPPPHTMPDSKLDLVDKNVFDFSQRPYPPSGMS